MRVDVKKLSIIILSGYISCLDIEIECVNFLRTTCTRRLYEYTVIYVLNSYKSYEAYYMYEY